MSRHPIEALLRPPVELWSMVVAFATAMIAVFQQPLPGHRVRADQEKRTRKGSSVASRLDRTRRQTGRTNQ